MQRACQKRLKQDCSGCMRKQAWWQLSWSHFGSSQEHNQIFLKKGKKQVLNCIYTHTYTLPACLVIHTAPTVLVLIYLDSVFACRQEGAAAPVILECHQLLAPAKMPTGQWRNMLLSSSQMDPTRVHSVCPTSSQQEKAGAAEQRHLKVLPGTPSLPSPKSWMPPESRC